LAYTFSDFVQKFPQVEMPVTLGEDSHHTFGTENETLPEEMIQQFILTVDGGSLDDELTEYIPCFAIQGTEHFIGLVWWKAELLSYSYWLATFKLSGELIDHQVIAFTRFGSDQIHRAVTTITEDLEIMAAEGISKGTLQQFDPTSSKMRHFEVMHNGQIVKG
jgi:hypothetical protein